MNVNSQNRSKRFDLKCRHWLQILRKSILPDYGASGTGLPKGDKYIPLLGKIIFESTVGGIIPRRSIVLVINNSLNSEGLMAFIAENAENGDEFLDYSIDQLNYFFTAIAQTWPGEWGEKPENSRLLHGAGLFALGRMMDEIFRFYLSIRNNDVPLLPPSYLL